jgi:hypothetical protein
MGTTLWTNIPSSKQATIQAKMNDYNRIFEGKPNLGTPPRGKKGWVPIKPMLTTIWHEENVKWLEEELPKSNIPTVVITHHAPCAMHLDDKRENGDVGHAYATDLSCLFKKPLVGWVSGHVHSAKSFRLTNDGPLLTCNAKGYPGEYVMGFDPKRVINVFADKMTE